MTGSTGCWAGRKTTSIRGRAPRLGTRWELYDLASDRTETHDLMAQRPDFVRQMYAVWQAWWRDRTGRAYTGNEPRKSENEE